MSRELTGHKGINLLNDSLRVTVEDNAYYIVPTVGNAAGLLIDFHTGPMEDGDYPKGISNEVLLVILGDRLAQFQKGRLACRETAIALTKLQEAAMWLQKRTRDRQARGVEGTNQE